MGRDKSIRRVTLPLNRSLSIFIIYIVKGVCTYHAFARTIEPLGILYPRYSSAEWVEWGKAISIKNYHQRNDGSQVTFN